MKTERTKGEWIVVESLNGDIYIGSENISIARIWSAANKADAEYICMAVNNHDKLVEALKDFMFACPLNAAPGHRIHKAYAKARTALAELEELK